MSDRQTLSDLIQTESSESDSSRSALLDIDVPAMTDRVQRRLRSRLRRRQVAGSCTLLLAAAVTVVFLNQHSTDNTTSPKKVEHATQLTDAEKDALRQAYLASVQQSDQMEFKLLNETNFSNDEWLTVDDHLHQTALIMLERAKHKASNPKLHDAALNDLHRLVDSFPDSPLVDEARRHIQVLQDRDRHPRSEFGNATMPILAFRSH